MSKKKSTKGGVIRKISKKSSIKKSKKESKKSSTKKAKKSEDEIIYEYIDKLKTHIHEKGLEQFVIFADTGFSKKLRNTTVRMMENIMTKDPKKYAGRTMIQISIKVTLPGKQLLEMKQGILVFCDIFSTKINNKGEIDKKTIGQISMHWEAKDLKIAKFSLKLVEAFARPVVKHRIKYVDLFGVPFYKMLRYFDMKKYPLDKSEFKPLKGL